MNDTPARAGEAARKLLRVLIADHEMLVRRGLCTRLANESDIEVVGEAINGDDAVEAIRRLRPDLVFLDVQLPGLDGFEVLDRLPLEQVPLVVFLTAYDIHAVRAFEVHALDYLVKPYSDERFQTCLNRARAAMASGDAPAQRQRLYDLLVRRGADSSQSVMRYPRRIAIRDGSRIMFLKAEEIEAIEAAGNYVQLVSTTGKHLLRLKLADMEEQLDPVRFTRIHRSTIVNVERVREVNVSSHGDARVVLYSGAKYRMSRTYRGRFFAEGGEALSG
jgi:two-component system LytT family response regulator